MTDRITSTQNPRIKNILQLQSKSRERLKQQVIVVEGKREITRALKTGHELVELFVCPDLAMIQDPEIKGWINVKVSLTEVSLTVFEKLAYRESSDGLLALLKPKFLQLQDLKLPDNPLLLILESVEKPGNLGAMMRTADAVGADAVIISDPLTDLYNPNTIRSSLGCIFTVPVVVTSTKEVQEWLDLKEIKSYAAALTEKAEAYYHKDFKGATAFILGTESTGLSSSWLNYCDSHIIIPMNGIADSLNVSVSGAILVYEAFRQRKQSKLE